MENNFFNPETNEQFYIPRYYTKVVEGEPAYFKTTRFKEQISRGGVILKKIETDIQSPGIRTDTKNRV